MKVILSTFGPLHLIKSADYLSHYVDIRVIQGWIPSWWNKWILIIASKIVKRDLFKAFQRRTPISIKGRNYSMAFAEFYLWACKLFKLLSPMKSSYNAACIYGWQSKRKIQDADIFHVRSGSGFKGAIELAKSRGMKVIVDHSIAHPAFMDSQLRNEYNKHGVLFNLGIDNPFWKGIISDCRKADAILVNSQFVKDTFIQNGFDEAKIKVCLLGVRDDFNSIKSDYNITNKTLKILFTGSFGFRKGAEYILKALADLDKEGFNYNFTCIGDSSGAENLIKLYRPKNITRINTIPQDELKKYLSEYDVYLFPSLCEGCASSGMEALSAGLPVIATKESGLPIENGVDGILIESKNVEEIKNALRLLASDSKLREFLGKSAAKKIRENYSWDKYAQNVVAIYQQLINKSNS